MASGYRQSDGFYGSEPVASRKTVPHPPWQAVPAPPDSAVPYRSPLAAYNSPAEGLAPSPHSLWEQKLYSVVSVPPGVILKIVPKP